MDKCQSLCGYYFIIFRKNLMLMRLFMSVVNMLKTWWRGKQGETQTRNLTKLLNPNEFLVLHDLTIENDTRSTTSKFVNKTTQIDSLVISLNTPDIFILETKKVEGEIYGNVDDEKWTLRTSKKDFQINNYLRQNYGHVKAVETLLRNNGLNVYSENIHSLVFVQPDQYNSKHVITSNPKDNESKRKSFYEHCFQTDCIANSNEMVLNFITQKTEAKKMRIINEPDNNRLESSPMKQRQILTCLNNHNKDGILDKIEHVQNVKAHVENKNKNNYRP